MYKYFIFSLLFALVLLAGCGENPNKPLDKDQTKVKSTGNEHLKEIIWQTDGAKMALISEGSFQMGDVLKDPEDFMTPSLPTHRVSLNAFYIDVCEVTLGQYKKFLKSTEHTPLPDWVDKITPDDNYPVIGVNWFDAKAYAEWAGKRLPTEAEWEYASRGGLIDKRFSHGNELTHTNANFIGKGGADIWDHPSPVASFKPNNYGLFDVMGNVWEWCEDLYDENYYAVSEPENPKGPESTPRERRVIRGGSWMSFKHFLRVALRNYQNPEMKNDHTGFRCVVDLN